jgi:hypothetical protein
MLTPRDINVKNHFFGSLLNNCEKETIARNIVIISCANDNKWFPFTWEGYKGHCQHKVSEDERIVLNELVKSGHLTRTDGVYNITDKFILSLSRNL